MKIAFCTVSRLLVLNPITPVPDDEILDWSKFKQIADNILTLSQRTNFRHLEAEILANDNSKLDENGKKFSKLVENTVGKGEIAHYEQFLLFPQCFQKTSTADT